MLSRRRNGCRGACLTRRVTWKTKATIFWWKKAARRAFPEYTALKAVRACVKKGALYDWWICSRDKTAAKLFVDDCKKWAEIYNLGAVELGEEIIEDETVFSITFSTGRTIFALSSNPVYWQASVVVWYWMNMRFINSSRNC